VDVGRLHQARVATTHPAKVLRGDLTPGFMVDLAHKDLGLAVELASQLGIEVPTGLAAGQAYEPARKEGYGRKDWTAIYTVLRDPGAAAPIDREVAATIAVPAS
jgi:4-hydroxybutyrate dehydrogenase/sulfolactaldehyde 3-reductase